MSNKIVNKTYEIIGRRTVHGMRIAARRQLKGKGARLGALAAVGVGVIAVGAVLARSHAPTE
jgi:hypothetical protein